MDVSEHGHLFPFCPYEFQVNSVTSPPTSPIPLFHQLLFFLVRIHFILQSAVPLLAIGVFPADVWRVKVVTSPHDYYRAKQSLPQPPSLLCILSFPPTGFHTQCWTFPHGTLLTCSAMTLVGGLELRKVRAPTRHRFEESVNSPNPSACSVVVK